MQSSTEQTLVILKPDAVSRGIMGEIVSRFERVGLKMVAGKFMQVSRELADKHYPASRKEFIEGMGNKTRENYADLGLDLSIDFGDKTDAHSIGMFIREWLVEMITSGPVFVMVWEGPHAVELVRKLCGHTLPLKSAPGTIRGDYSYDSSALANFGKRPIKNLMHASGNVEEAVFEVKLWFSADEITTYTRVQEVAMK
ncbi:MAG TPA: nucleoside-diphosphate kinase [Candidatus Woesebacteria bacterium]|nr:nucleoside-diphosphate kinase [Candidatus Woesebacteria bacterium]HNS95027.1 nucleoside-diphosphate kinase [Candidatus Woesebacteria bacterium]